jgi:hypothetical protein
MELGPSWEAASCEAIQELFNIHKSPYPEQDQSSPYHLILSL